MSLKNNIPICPYQPVLLSRVPGNQRMRLLTRYMPLIMEFTRTVERFSFVLGLILKEYVKGLYGVDPVKCEDYKI